MAIDDTVGGLVTGLVTAAVLSHFVKSAMASRAETLADGSQVLRYSKPMRIAMGICGLLIFSLFASVPFWAPDEAKTPGTAAFLAVVCIVMGSLGVYAALEFPFVRIVHDAVGITGFAPWRKPRVIAWSDVRSVEYSASAQWFVIKGHDGATIRASLLLSGIRQLHDALHVRVPREYWKSDHAAFHGR